jgi:hypothetical protein
MSSERVKQLRLAAAAGTLAATVLASTFLRCRGAWT